MDDEERLDAKRVLHGERFHHAIVAKGTVFAAVFYLLLIGFLLGTVASIVTAVTGGQLLNAVPGLLLGAAIIYFVREEDLYSIIAVLLLPYIVLGLVLVYTTATMLSSFVGTFTSPTLTTAVFTAIPILIIGAVSAYLFNPVSTTRRQLGAPALTGSTIIAAGAGMARIVQAAIQQLAGGGGGSGVIPQPFLELNAASNPEALFVTALLAFNIPFLYYANQRFALGRRDAAWYLLPVALYLLIGVVGGTLLF